MARDIGLLLWLYGLMSLGGIWWWLGLRKFFSGLADHGYVISRLIGWWFGIFVVWLLGHFIDLNLRVGGLIALILGGFLCQLLTRKIAIGIPDWRPIVLAEVVGLVIFVAYGLVRGYQPDILGLEKFMDYGFMQSYSISNKLPASDMWWAGGAINYYSFGHYWAAEMSSWWRVPTEVGYNIMLALIFSSCASLVITIVYSMGSNKKSGRNLWGSVIGALLVLVGGNSHTLITWLQKFNLKGYWYADATRFIPFTIHEFPSYSFVVSDLHGHVLSLPMVLTLLCLVIAYLASPGAFLALMIGWMLSMLMMTNTWDLMIYGVFGFVLLTFILLRKQWKVEKYWHHSIFLISALVIGSTVWLREFVPISQGIGLVKERSGILMWLTLWSGHLFISLLALKESWKDKTIQGTIVMTCVATALVLLVLPEIIYFKDIYPNHPRANTMFKFTYQAFVLMGIAGGYLLTKERGRGVRERIANIVTAGVIAGLMLFPFFSYPIYYNNFKGYKGLDGISFLSEKYPSQLEIIRLLRTRVGEGNLIEAVGDSYTEFDFVSAFSGVPTIVGWRVHEWLWRGSYDPVANRTEEVKRFFETDDQTTRSSLIKKYDIKFVLVSEKERSMYKVQDKLIGQLSRVIYENGGSRVYEIMGN